MLNKNDNFKLREIIGIENIDYVGMIRIRKMMNVPCQRGREGCLKAYGYAEARVRQSTMFIFQ